MLTINEVYGQEGKQVRVVAVEHDHYVVTDAQEFGPNYRVSPQQMESVYGATDAAIVSVDEQAAWKAFAKAWKPAQPVEDEADPLPTPNSVFGDDPAVAAAVPNEPSWVNL